VTVGSQSGGNATSTTTMPGTTTTVQDAASEYAGVELPAWIPPIVANWVIAILVVVVAWYVSKVVVKLAGRTVARRIQRPSVTRTALRIVQASVIFVGVSIAAGIIGFQAGDILLSVTVFSAMLGIVLAPIVGSIINGLFVLADQPYEIGDMIEIADTGERGFVEDITIRYTKIFTLENTFIVISNSNIRERDVVNYSAEDERTRLSLSITVTYEGDVAEARSLIERAARDVDEVISGGPDIRIGSARYPAAPTCYIDEFADHGVKLTLRYWAMEPYKLLTVRSAVKSNVWDALADADVEIAYPHSHVVFDDTSGELGVATRERPLSEEHFPADGIPNQQTDAQPDDDGR
jgi:small conductance mechanosensitive channel